METPMKKPVTKMDHPRDTTRQNAEQRREGRHSTTNGGMEISLFCRHASHRAEARLLNFGRDGVCLESRKRFPSQSIVYVRVIGRHPVAEEGGRRESPRNGSLAKVLWVRQGNDPHYPFKIGMKYFSNSEVNF